jgi:RNA polymerase sigma-70 factor, ECF subfamily
MTSTPAKQPPCHRTVGEPGARRGRARRRGAAECYRSATQGNGSVPLLADSALGPKLLTSGWEEKIEVVVSEEELSDLFKRYASYVATIGFRLLGRDDELDDLVQEVFIEAYRGFHQLRSPDAAKAWLARITVRRAIRRLRRRRLRSFFSLESLPPDARLIDDGATPEEKADVASTYRMVERLPVRQRVVWVLKHVEGETLDAIGEICGISKATVQRRLRAAERALQMQKLGGPDGQFT